MNFKFWEHICAFTLAIWKLIGYTEHYWGIKFIVNSCWHVTWLVLILQNKYNFHYYLYVYYVFFFFLIILSAIGSSFYGSFCPLSSLIKPFLWKILIDSKDIFKSISYWIWTGVCPNEDWNKFREKRPYSGWGKGIVPKWYPYQFLPFNFYKCRN